MNLLFPLFSSAQPVIFEALGSHITVNSILEPLAVQTSNTQRASSHVASDLGETAQQAR